MRALRLRFFMSICLMGTSLLGCGPGSQGQENERLASIENEIRELEDSAEEDPNAESDLDREIQQYQGMISALSVETSMQQQTYANEMRGIEFQQNQASQLIRDRVNSITERMQTLERNIADKRPLVYGLIPPPETLDTAMFRAEITQTEQELNTLQQEKSALLAESYSLPEQYTGQLNRTLDSIRSRQIDLAFLIASARSDLANATDQKRKLIAEREEREKQLALLRQERAKLAVENTEPE